MVSVFMQFFFSLLIVSFSINLLITYFSFINIPPKFNQYYTAISESIYYIVRVSSKTQLHLGPSLSALIFASEIYRLSAELRPMLLKARSFHNCPVSSVVPKHLKVLPDQLGCKIPKNFNKRHYQHFFVQILPLVNFFFEFQFLIIRTKVHYFL